MAGTRKQTIEFYDRITDLIEREWGYEKTHYTEIAGHHRDGYGDAEYVLSSELGPIRISIEGVETGRLPSWHTLHDIFCMFLDVDKAAGKLAGEQRFNRYSGKYNFHYGMEHEPLSVVQDFRRHIEKHLELEET